MAGKEAVLILLASCWEGQVLARLFLPEDLAGIEPEAVYPAAAEVVLALSGLPVCDPLDLLAGQLAGRRIPYPALCRGCRDDSLPAPLLRRDQRQHLGLRGLRAFAPAGHIAF